MTAHAPITVYFVGALGAITVHAELLEVREPRKGKVLRAVQYIPRGKRLAVAVTFGTMLVLEGDEHPEAPLGFVMSGDFPQSRYRSFDPRYHTDFNRWANGYIREHQVTPLLDQREHLDETTPTLDMPC